MHNPQTHTDLAVITRDSGEPLTETNIAGDQVHGRVLSAFAAWLKLSAGAGLDGPALASHPLTKAAMEGLKSVDTFEDASDAVCELVLCTASRGEPEPQMMPLVQLLVPAVSVWCILMSCPAMLLPLLLLLALLPPPPLFLHLPMPSPLLNPACLVQR